MGAPQNHSSLGDSEASGTPPKMAYLVGSTHLAKVEGRRIRILLRCGTSWRRVQAWEVGEEEE